MFHYYFQCTCEPGYEGKNCEIDINECLPAGLCNNGICKDEINSYKCDCSLGFNGTNCEININECESNPCVNGKCVDEINDFSCQCLPGWTGEKCDHEINECIVECDSNSTKSSTKCVKSPCYNGAHCTDKVNNFTCTCSPGFKGKFLGTICSVKYIQMILIKWS